jgi:hypothetical protein
MFVIVSLLDEEEDCCLVFRFTSLIHSSPLRAFLETPVVEKRQEEVQECRLPFSVEPLSFVVFVVYCCWVPNKFKLYQNV